MEAWLNKARCVLSLPPARAAYRRSLSSSNSSSAVTVMMNWLDRWNVSGPGQCSQPLIADPSVAE